jgi:hypothetical protein
LGGIHCRREQIDILDGIDAQQLADESPRLGLPPPRCQPREHTREVRSCAQRHPRACRAAHCQAGVRLPNESGRFCLKSRRRPESTRDGGQQQGETRPYPT